MTVEKAEKNPWTPVVKAIVNSDYPGNSAPSMSKLRCSSVFLLLLLLALSSFFFRHS